MEQGIENTSNFAKELFIIGNGVIAKALAVALALNGRKVTILRGSIDGELRYTENIQVEIGAELLQAEIAISSISNYEKLDGIILLTNKSFGNKALAEKLQLKAQESPIVFLQNGLHIENCFIDLGFKELYRCVLMATSQSVSENRVRFRLVAPSPIGWIKGSEEVLQLIVETLNTTIFSFRDEADIQKLIWKKVISNCVFNSICPLLEVDNGVFQRNDAVLEIAKTVIAECLTVAIANGIQLTQDEVLQNVLAISKMSDGIKISTYQDILNKRETEIDTLNFAVAKAGGPGISIPVTTLLGELTKIKSDLSRA
ncbi:ketopantoate reductase C-terminal domain-containing protein [Pedobacter gandavensis]|uniref:ketopantoate reductase C-terminal domain-containing protein n=1 Tax=Pedobacter gandavensis TaxID=2679963 RepID=UPI00292E6E26|nr:ketopantoate reductase C-terminal domain-containing protein [Pedobacter gandavensis]